MGLQTVLVILAAIAMCFCVSGVSSRSRTQILELHLACDKTCYTKMTSWGEEPMQYIADLIKEVNARFAQLNLVVVLVDLEFWNGVNTLDTLDTSAVDNMFALRSVFGAYRHRIGLDRVWSDASILLTGTELPSPDGSHDKGAFMTGSMCERSNGAGIVKYNSQPASHLAATVVHELGHGLGMPHDTFGCCSAGMDNCIMATYINQYQIDNPQFSDCSKAAYDSFLATSRSSCLDDEPPRLYPLPGVDTCGNGIVEDDEQCDCPEGCTCCDSNCQLTAGAQCWQGGCCDSACQIVGAGVVCNPSSGDSCDQDDVCNGTSSECPLAHEDNGIDCSGPRVETGYCYQGKCLTRDLQCAESWNPGYKGGKMTCYQTSLTISSSISHCGPIAGRPGQYHKCTQNKSSKYFKCGLLQCQYVTHPDWTETNIDQARDADYNFFVSDQCMSGNSYEWEAGQGGPLMITDGTKCDLNMVCLDTRCLNKDLVYAELANRTTVKREVSLYCGDGEINADEECDCGPMQCDCCSDQCMLLSQGTPCAFTECKVCDGSNVQCPNELWMQDFKECQDEGHCYRGNCVSLAASCKKYFGGSSAPAYVLYRNTSLQNDSQNNMGGYKLYNSDTDSLVEEEFRKVADKECGVLLCQSYNTALVFGENGTLQHSKTFRTDQSWTYRYAYYNTEETHIGPNATFGSFYPLLAEQGSPCHVDGKPGYCNKHHLTLSETGNTWYWYSNCLPISTTNMEKPT